MAKIFSVFGRAGMARILDPAVRGLLRAGVTPNAVTVAGTVSVLVGAGFATQGHLVLATIWITLSAFTDLMDGAMARRLAAESGRRPNRFGAFLDSTMDRVADGAIFGAAAYWLAVTDQRLAFVGALLCLVLGQVVSYAKARAEGLGMTANVGVAERAERLILIGVGALLQAAGVPYALAAVLWLLAVLSLVTIAQRIVVVYRQAHAGPAAVPPAVGTDEPAGGDGHGGPHNGYVRSEPRRDQESPVR